MSKLLVMIIGIACAASVAAAEGQPRKVWTARDVIIASGGVPPEDMQATPAEPAVPAAAPAKAKGKKAKVAKTKKKKAAKRAKKRAKRR